MRECLLVQSDQLVHLSIGDGTGGKLRHVVDDGANRYRVPAAAERLEHLGTMLWPLAGPSGCRRKLPFILAANVHIVAVF
jgi:hypothetical protein